MHTVELNINLLMLLLSRSNCMYYTMCTILQFYFNIHMTFIAIISDVWKTIQLFVCLLTNKNGLLLHTKTNEVMLKRNDPFFNS